MKVVHSPLHARHDGGMELHRGELVPCFEMPVRADYILKAVERAGFEVCEPRPFPLESLLRVHDAGFVEFLRTAHAEWRAAGKTGFMLPSGFPARSLRRDHIPSGINGKMGYYAFDAGTPIVEGTWDAALASAHCALTAAAWVAEGEKSAYALCRPPGHHAGHSLYGGYCFLNNAAAGGAAPARQGIRPGRGAGRRLPPRQRHPGHLLGARRRAVRVHPRPPRRPSIPYFLGYADERGRRRGRGLHPQLPAAARHRLDGVQRRAGRRAGRSSVGSRPTPWWCRSASTPTRATRSAPSSWPRSTTRRWDGAWPSSKLPTVFVQEGGYAVDDIGTNVAGVLEGFLGRR